MKLYAIYGYNIVKYEVVCYIWKKKFTVASTSLFYITTALQSLNILTTDIKAIQQDLSDVISYVSVFSTQ